MNVKTTHYRFFIADGASGPMVVLAPMYAIRALGFGRFVEPRGGFTRVDLELGNSATITAWARCSPTDNYVKAEGRRIAVERAQRIALAFAYPRGSDAYNAGARAWVDSQFCSPEREWGPARTATLAPDPEAGIAALSIPIKEA